MFNRIALQGRVGVIVFYLVGLVTLISFTSSLARGYGMSALGNAVFALALLYAGYLRQRSLRTNGAGRTKLEARRVNTDRPLLT
jgi:hypothetical protein